MERIIVCAAITNNFKVAFTAIKSNKKNILLSVVGLSIAFMIAFQMLLFLFGTKGVMLSQYVSGNYNEGLFGSIMGTHSEPNIGPDIEMGYTSDGFVTNDTHKELREDLNSVAVQSGHSRIYADTRISAILPVTIHYTEGAGGPPRTRAIQLIGLCEDDLDFIRENLLYSWYFSGLNENRTLMIFLQELVSPIYIPSSLQVNISYVYQPGIKCNVSLPELPIDLSAFTSSEFEALTNGFKRQLGYSVLSDAVLMVTSLSGLGGIMERLNLTSTTPVEFAANVDLDYSSLNFFSNKADHRAISGLRETFQTYLSQDSEKTNIYVFNRLSSNLEPFQQEFVYVQIIVLTLIIPPTAIALFMINFSFNLVRKQNIRQINLLKARGAKKSQILIILLLESTIATVISLIIGGAISVPFFLLISKTSGFMEFQSELRIFDYGLSITWQAILTIVAAGVLISVLINIPRILYLTRLPVRNIAGEEERRKPPFWRRIYLDFILGGVSLVDLVMYILAINYFTGNSREILLMVFGVSTPILMVVAITMLISRLFSPTVRWLGNKLWSLKGGTFALSVKNLSHRDKQTSRAVILIVITLTFCIVSAVVPSTIDFNVSHRWNYVVGADVSLYLVPTEQAFYDHLGESPYVAAYSHAIWGEEMELFLGSGPFVNNVLGIDVNTFRAASNIIPSNCRLSRSFSYLLGKLAIEGNILMQRNVMREHGLKVGSQVGFQNHKYTIVGSFKYFPIILTDYELQDAVSFENYIVGSRETIADMVDFYSSPSIYRDMCLVKQTEPGKGMAIVNHAKQYDDTISFTVSEDGAEVDLGMPARIPIYAMLNSAFLATVICTIAGLIIYSTLILFDRSKELSLIRALGGLVKELYRAFLFEASLLLLIGMLIGVPVGILTSTIVSNIITSYYNIPPIVVAIPWVSLIIIIVVVLMLAAGGAAIPAYFASKKEINDLARAT